MRLAARSDKLLVHDVGEEAIVYDRTNDRAHRLNPVAARVWRALDGEKTIEQLATELGTQPGIVELAIGRLGEAGLLTGQTAALSRRRVLRRVVGMAVAGMMVPVVSSIAAPTPQQAKSPDIIT